MKVVRKLTDGYFTGGGEDEYVYIGATYEVEYTKEELEGLRKKMQDGIVVVGGSAEPAES